MKRATGHLSGAIEYERAHAKRDCSVAGSMESPKGGSCKRHWKESGEVI